jgi:formylglycine-generating enzyme required for sulfatase activity
MADARRAFAALTLAVALALPAAAQAPSWLEDSWNPRRAAEDLVLPLPCGGAMAFRPVPVPVPPGALADREVTLGQPDRETATQEFLRRSFLAGGFPGPRTADPPRYFIAKYEVTRDQWAAVMATDCPALPTPQGRLPQTEITFAEAVEFTTRLSTWLTRNARDRLPRVEEAVAFARLPTEDEWEYAARGGAAVSEAEFGDRAYPMPEGILGYEFFQGARSADRQARPVGSLRANPLGLHDMLGNVAEWTLESFRLNKAGRPHGLAGGQVARGGSFLRPEDEIRAAMREEFLPVDAETGAPRRMRHVGLRPVLARGTTTSAAQFRRLTEAFEQESRSRTTAAEDPLRLLDLLQAEATDSTQRAGIERVRATLQAEARARRDQESAALRGHATAAVHLARQIRFSIETSEIFVVLGDVEQARFTNGEQIQQSIARLGQAASTPEMRARLTEASRSLSPLVETSRNLATTLNNIRLPAARQRIAELADDYLSQLTVTARGADPTRLAAEARVVAQQFEARNIGEYGPIARLVARHLDAVAAGRSLTRDEVLRDLGAPQPPPATAPAPPRR